MESGDEEALRAVAKSLTDVERSLNMKLNRFVAMAALAMLAIGAMGIVTARTFAQTTTQPAAQDQVCADQDNDADVADEGPDTDDSDVQCGAQDENDADDDAEDVDADQDQDAAALGSPLITAEEAQATAESHLNAGTASEVELDNEGGQLVYSVEINGTDVKIDALTGAVLSVANAED